MVTHRLKQSQELQLFAVRYRFAYEELVYDLKMQEANVLANVGRLGVSTYLKGVYGGRWKALRALRADLRGSGARVPKVDWQSHDEKIKEWYRLWRLPGIGDELLYRCKEAEAVALFKTVRAMYAYLLENYGDSRLQVLRMLRDVRAHGRRKTLHLERKSKDGQSSKIAGSPRRSN